MGDNYGTTQSYYLANSDYIDQYCRSSSELRHKWPTVLTDTSMLNAYNPTILKKVPQKCFTLRLLTSLSFVTTRIFTNFFLSQRKLSTRDLFLPQIDWKTDMPQLGNVTCDFRCKCTDFYFRKVCKLCVMHLTILICQKCFLKEW
mgnify:CR=1 FL=1